MPLYALRQAEQFINPSDFGASGDGTTNDGAALQAALDAASTTKKPVLLEARTYSAPSGLSVPPGVLLAGTGFESVIGGRLVLGDGASVRDLTVDMTDCSPGHSMTANGATSVNVDRVHFKGSSTHNIYLNDSRATDVKFVDCWFTDAVMNGVQIVDKGTALKHFENISFTRCTFRDNGRMNFECIQRSDVGNPVVSGYRGIDLIDCTLDPSGATDAIKINVSYDAGLLADGTARSSGYSTISGCRITGGSYGIELAGARDMRVIGNEVRDTTSFLLSISQIENEDAQHLIANNVFAGVSSGSVVFQGANNTITGNFVKTAGVACRMNPAKTNLVAGNHFETTGVTCVSLESAADNRFMGNTIVGGTNQTVLNIYVASVDNAFLGNNLVGPNVVFDLRDSTVVQRAGNRRKAGSTWYNSEQSYQVSALPTAGQHWRGAILTVTGASGVADGVYMCTKDASNAYAWRALTLT